MHKHYWDDFPYKHQCPLQDDLRLYMQYVVKTMGIKKDPKMEVLYHISGHILLGYSLKFRPY